MQTKRHMRKVERSNICHEETRGLTSFFGVFQGKCSSLHWKSDKVSGQVGSNRVCTQIEKSRFSRCNKFFGQRVLSKNNLDHFRDHLCKIAEMPKVIPVPTSIGTSRTHGQMLSFVFQLISNTF